MVSSNGKSNRLLFKLINASAGVFRQYQITFWSQLVLGFLYSFGYFDSEIAGFVLGFVMPVLWIILTYRYVLVKARENVKLPFPSWMQKNPGNSLVIVVDIVFLALIWLMILSGFYEATWVKVLFTIVFPILTLSMLRNLVIYPFSEEKQPTNDAGEQSTHEENHPENKNK
ncbi:MAG: hypothetical protein ACOCXV_03090 [Bacteroidota bacterium]